MNKLVGSIIVALALLGAAQFPPAQAQTHQSTAPDSFPKTLRWDLVPKWIEWSEAQGVRVKWPPNDGCTAAPEVKTLAAGTLIQRFGSESGSIFVPKGTSFRSQSLPYVCTAMDFRVYRVVKPVTVKSCKAAPWFDQPGGAVQLEATKPAYQLVADGMIRRESFEAAGSGTAAPQCGRPR